MARLVFLVYFFLALFFTIFVDGKCPFRKTPSENKDGEYDFIVVGGGTGGAVTAARLSENFNVLLLESGERLYDNDEVNAKFVDDLLMGFQPPAEKIRETEQYFKKFASSFFPSTKFSKNLGNKFSKEDNEKESVLNEVATMGLHIQKTPFMVPFVIMSDACFYHPLTPQWYSQKREVYYPRGNMIGGSSGANWMVYFRGSRHDFDDLWRDTYQLRSWGLDSLLPFFKKFENNTVRDDPKIHGKDGPIEITKSMDFVPFEANNAWFESAQRMGWKEIEDASNPETTYGISKSWQQMVSKSGRRMDSSEYIRLKDLEGKVCWNKEKKDCYPHQTLHIWTKKHATKVLINPKNKRAYGVEYVDANKFKYGATTANPLYEEATSEGKKHRVPFTFWDKDARSKIPTAGAPVDRDLATDYNHPEKQYIPPENVATETKTVTAKKEIILSSGCIVTAHLLMLSGIGPKKLLEEKDIEVIADLPVGQNIADHQEVTVTFKFPKEYKPPFNMMTDALKGFPSIRNYLKGEQSIMGSNMVVGGLDGSPAGPDGKISTFHLHHIPFGILENADVTHNLIEEGISGNARLPRSLFELFTWTGLQYHSHLCELSGIHNRGRIELRNKDPLTHPFVDLRYAASNSVIRELTHCVKLVREIVNHTDHPFGGEEVGHSANAKTDGQIAQFIRNSVWGHHIGCSAPMSCNKDDGIGVTDEEARVFEVEGLRVADISIFPVIPHANPTGVILMAAEKISDRIKHQWMGTKHDEL